MRRLALVASRPTTSQLSLTGPVQSKTSFTSNKEAFTTVHSRIPEGELRGQERF